MPLKYLTIEFGYSTMNPFVENLAQYIGFGDGSINIGNYNFLGMIP